MWERKKWNESNMLQVNQCVYETDFLKQEYGILKEKFKVKYHIKINDYHEKENHFE